MNVGYAKFQKKFDSRTISRELPKGGAPITELKTSDALRKAHEQSLHLRWHTHMGLMTQLFFR